MTAATVADGGADGIAGNGHHIRASAIPASAIRASVTLGNGIPASAIRSVRRGSEGPASVDRALSDPRRVNRAAVNAPTALTARIRNSGGTVVGDAIASVEAAEVARALETKGASNGRRKRRWPSKAR